MKKFKSLKLMLLGVLAMGSMNAFAQELTDGKLKWTVNSDGKTCEVTGFAPGYKADEVVIPTTVINSANASQKYTVTSVKKGAFSGIKGIDLQTTGITSINKDVFNIKGLETIKLGAKVESIEEGAFSNTSLKTLDLSATSVAEVKNLFGSHEAYKISDVTLTTPTDVYEANKALAQSVAGKSVSKDDPDTSNPILFDDATAAAYNKTLPGAVQPGAVMKFNKATANAYNWTTFGASYPWIVTSDDDFVYTAEYASDYNAGLKGSFEAGEVLTDQTARLYNKFQDAALTTAVLDEAWGIYLNGLKGARPATGSASTKFATNNEAYNYTKSLFGDDPDFVKAGTFTTQEEADEWSAAHPDETPLNADDVNPDAYDEDGNLLDGYAVSANAANTANRATFGLAAAVKDDFKTFKTQADANNYNKKFKENAYPAFDSSTFTPGDLSTANLDTQKFVQEILYKKAGDALTKVDADAYNATITGAISLQDDDSDPATPDVWLDADGNKGPLDEDGNRVKFTDEEAYQYNLNYEASLGLGILKKDGDLTGTIATEETAAEYNATLEGAVAAGEETGAYGKLGETAANNANVALIKKAEEKPYDLATNNVVKGHAVAANQFKALESVKLPASWVKIVSKKEKGADRAYGAFEGCSNLATVDFGGNPYSNKTKKGSQPKVEIQDYAFLGTALTAIDLSKTKVDAIPATIIVDAVSASNSVKPNNTSLESVTINTEINAVKAMTFANCKGLTSFNFPTDEAYENAGYDDPTDDPAPVNPFYFHIGSQAFANTAIESFTLPTYTYTVSPSAVDATAFSGCGKLKSFTFLTDESYPVVLVDNEAFPGCKGVTFYTTNTYVAAAGGKAPKNCKFNVSSPDDYVTPFYTKEYAKVPGKYYIKFHATQDIKVKKDEAKVYNAYIDNAYDALTGLYEGDLTLNMCLYKYQGGYYNITAGADVLIITNKKDLEYEEAYGLTSGSWLTYESEQDAINAGETPYDDNTINALKIVLDKDGMTLGELDALAGTDRVVYGWVNSATAGTGWQKITTAVGKDGQNTKFKAGDMYILAAEPTKDARLNVRWLDENGNLDAEATGIKNINTEAVDSEAIFNLQGVRVSGAQKGIFIQNGKKYVK